MTTFLVLYRTGPNPEDLKVTGISEGRKKDEGEKAIAEMMTEGEGEYIAVEFDEKKIVVKQAVQELTLTDPTEPVEAEPAPEDQEEQPEPEPETS